MESQVIEASYPLSFRTKDAFELGKHLKNRHSVVLVGMKRVGISNFLRFFLNHPEIGKKYINDDKTHLFIPVDLNDLVERELFPFWVLTLKRIEDAVGKSQLPDKTKKYVETLFLDSIQSQDLFLTIESVRKSLSYLVEQNIVPSVFFLRFDRIKDVVTSEFFANLQGLIDAAHQNLSYVFTSVRSLESLSPNVFTRASVSVFARTLYIAPSLPKDSEMIFKKNVEKYKMSFTPAFEKKLLSLVDGYNQYLQFALTFLHEKGKKVETEKLFDELLKDERIMLQSEELWESLTVEEQEVLKKFAGEKKVTFEDKVRGEYLFNTGIVNSNDELFSPLFESFLQTLETKKTTQVVELSKKENKLLKLLEENRGALCERENIIQGVWPEVESFGVSDWAVDRLVARLRNKLKMLNNTDEIVTVKTRGYKLI